MQHSEAVAYLVVFYGVLMKMEGSSFSDFLRFCAEWEKKNFTIFLTIYDFFIKILSIIKSSIASDSDRDAHIEGTINYHAQKNMESCIWFRTRETIQQKKYIVIMLNTTVCGYMAQSHHLQLFCLVSSFWYPQNLYPNQTCHY